jgi:hypothetical protein
MEAFTCMYKYKYLSLYLCVLYDMPFCDFAQLWAHHHKLRFVRSFGGGGGGVEVAAWAAGRSRRHVPCHASAPTP